jgi:hypothetical protein
MRPDAAKPHQYEDKLPAPTRARVRDAFASRITISDDCGNWQHTTYGALECAITAFFFDGARVIYDADTGEPICYRYAAVVRMRDSARLRKMVKAGHFSVRQQTAITGWSEAELKALRKQLSDKR